MGKIYTVIAENLATETVAALPPEALGSCDTACGMSLVELRDFWWAYSYDLINRLPSTTDERRDRSPRILKASADDLMTANNATQEEFFRRRIEPRLGMLQVARFAFNHLVPALALQFSPDLKIEVQSLISEKYGAGNK